MSEHYSGHDPETGCGLMLLAALVVLVVVVVLVTLWAVSGASHLP